MSKLSTTIVLAVLAVGYCGYRDNPAENYSGLPSERSSSGGSWPEERVTIKGDVMSDVAAHKFLDLFRASCRPLGESDVWKADVAVVEATAEIDPIEEHHDIGWNVRLSVGVKLKDELKRLPNYTAETGVMAGQTLWYDIGFTGKPGFFAYKRSSQFACGMDPVGEQQFRPLTGL